MIRIAYSKANEILRVRGDDKEELPAAFYKGTTDFNGQKDDTDGGGSLVADGGVPPAPGRGNEFDSVAETADAGKADDGASRDVVESDIWSIHNDTLYFFNSLRGLQVIDLKDKPFIRYTMEGYFSMKMHALVRFGKWQQIADAPMPENPDLYCVSTSMHHYAKGVAYAAM